MADRLEMSRNSDLPLDMALPQAKNVVSITAHPKYTRHFVSLDMQGRPFRVGDQFVDITGNRGEIRQLLENDCASVIVDDYYRSFIIDTGSLLRVPG